MSVINYIIRIFRILLDSYVCLIGLIYPENREYLPPINDLLLLESAISLSNKIKKGKVKSVDVMRAFIERINSVNPHINALIDNRFSAALDEAINVDIRVQNQLSGNKLCDEIPIDSQPFLGIPFTVKDGIGIEGMVQSSGSKKRVGIIADKDAAFVTRMRESGAIPIGISNTSEMHTWWDAYNKLYGGTNNPYDKSRIPGGSSGGEGALLASAAFVIGIGSDFSGSIRIPANFCGIYGHTTTANILPIDGVFPKEIGHRVNIITFGPMCRYVTDLRPMLKVMTGDSSMLQLDKHVNVRDIKIYYVEEYINDPIITHVQSEVKDAINKSLEYLRQRGAEIKKIKLKSIDDAFNIYMCGVWSDIAPKCAEIITNKSGVSINPYLELVKHIFGCSDHTLAAIVSSLLDNFTIKNDTLQKYIQIGNHLKNQIQQILGDDGILIFPTHPETAPKHNATILTAHNCLYVSVFTTLNVCITQVPITLSKNGMPIGVQVIGSAYKDHLTISVAEDLDKHFGGWKSP